MSSDVTSGQAEPAREDAGQVARAQPSEPVDAVSGDGQKQPAVPDPQGPADEPVGLPWTPIGGPSVAAWREEILTRAQELAGLTTWVDAQRGRKDPTGRLRKAIENQLTAARATAEGLDRDGKRLGRVAMFRATLGGAAFERGLGNLDAAETSLLRYAPDGYVRGQLPSVTAHVNRFLEKADPRRVAVEALSPPTGADPMELTPLERERIIAAFHAANTQRRRNLLRVRSFRNVVAAAVGVLTLLALAVGYLGYQNPDWMPLCFEPQATQTVVCPQASAPLAANASQGDGTASGSQQETAPTEAPAAQGSALPVQNDDVILIEFLGAIAAALAGAVALRRLSGTTTPYGIPLALILLKLPTGALTAVLGLLFIRGDFVPGLTALDSSAQIIAWAIVFGFSQQLLTRLVDNQAQGVLTGVGGRGASGNRGPAAA